MRPIFETPRLDDLTPASGARKGFFGSVAAGYEAQRAFDNIQSREMVLSRAYGEYLSELEAATGERLASGGAFGGTVDTARLDLGRRGTRGEQAFEALQREFSELQARRPDLDLPPPSSVMEHLRGEAVEIESAEAQAGFVGGFIGRLGGALTDPITLATAPIGGASKTILRAAGVEAAANALLEAGNIPIANGWRAELGVDTMDAGEAATSIAIAAGAGAVLGGGGKAVELGLPRAFNRLSNTQLARALRDLSGDNPERAALASALEREAAIEASNPFAPGDADLHEQRLQDAVTVLTEPGSEPAQAAASRLAERVAPPATRPVADLTLDGYRFPDGLHRRLYALGQSPDADMAEADALLQAFKGFATEEEGLSDLASAEDMVAYARGYAQDVVEDGDAFDVIDPDQLRDWQRRHGAPAPSDPLAGSLPSGLTQLDPRELEVDAARFQFKAGGDASGVTDRLAGVTQWDPVRAGIAIVFEQEDGRRFIADGHQRRGLAARLLDDAPDQDIRLTAFVYREADGWSDADIRAVAAAKNLAEGTGTAIDAAKILRADPSLLDGSLPSRGALIRDAQGLMRLGDPAFGAVINEVVPANYGAIVGRIIDDPDEQLAVLEQLARAEVRNAIEAEALVRGAQAAGFARREGSTGSLFGDVPTESLIADRARTLSSAIAILRKEKTVFSTLAREADRIESAGNQLARDANQQRARSDGELLEILQTLAHRSGPVADSLNARVRQSDGNTAAAARNFVGDLRDLTAQGDLGRLLDGGSGRNADPATPGGAAGAARLDAPPADLEPGRFDGGADDPAMVGQADNLAPAANADPDEDFDTGVLFDAGEGPRRERVTAAEVEAEIAADDAAVERLRGCVPK